VYDGAFQAGRRQGMGKLTYATGQVVSGDWFQGILRTPDVEAAPAP
jgi:MORN repeat